MKKRLVILIISLVLEISGAVLVGVFSSWLVTLGMFLFIAGSNISSHFELREDFRAYLKQ